MGEQPKWTPGPWHVGKDPEEDEGFGWFVGGGGFCRANIVGPIIDTKANAHLIAAAPDLYEALAEIDRWSRKQGIALPSPSIYSALAKARGET